MKILATYKHVPVETFSVIRILVLFGIVVSAVSEKETCIDDTDVARSVCYTVLHCVTLSILGRDYCFKGSLCNYKDN